MIKVKANNIQNSLQKFYEIRGLRAEHVKGFLYNYPDADIYVDSCESIGCVFATRNKDEGFLYLDCLDPSYIGVLGAHIDDKEYVGFGGMDIEISNAIIEKYSKELYWQNPCDLFYYPEKSIEPFSFSCGILTDVNIKDAQFIDDNYTYRGEGSLENIKENIVKRPTAAIYVDGKISSWSLVHEDNTMGIMYTLPECRGLGLAQAVAHSLIQKVLDTGNMPFIHIVANNFTSKRLSARCGMKFSHYVNWFGIRTR